MCGEKTKKAVLKALQRTGLADGLTGLKRIESGMTNYQYWFQNNGQSYLLRIPGEGTDYLINRRNEASVYKLLEEKGITDDVIYINADTGIKITRYMDMVHHCRIEDADEVRSCMRHLRRFHQMNFKVKHVFDVFREIERYESRCRKAEADLVCYKEIRAEIFGLRPLFSRHQEQVCLCHIDPVADNFLINGKEVYLIDWEYAAMCDPHIDIAMFCIYAGYDKASTDRTIDAYFDTGCKKSSRRKIYAYMSVCAYLWVLWSEIKQAAGTDFTKYKEEQLRLAKLYYRLTLGT